MSAFERRFIERSFVVAIVTDNGRVEADVKKLKDVSSHVQLLLNRSAQWQCGDPGRGARQLEVSKLTNVRLDLDP